MGLTVCSIFSYLASFSPLADTVLHPAHQHRATPDRNGSHISTELQRSRAKRSRSHISTELQQLESKRPRSHTSTELHQPRLQTQTGTPCCTEDTPDPPAQDHTQGVKKQQQTQAKLQQSAAKAKIQQIAERRRSRDSPPRRPHFCPAKRLPATRHVLPQPAQREHTSQVSTLNPNLFV